MESKGSTRTVSMPFIGLPSFLHSQPWNRKGRRGLFQCPSLGFPHFYSMEKIGLRCEKAVSMPFIGLPSFLRGGIMAKIYVGNVSMPFIGLPSFLHEVKVRALRRLWQLFQCPSLGFPHFYENMARKKIELLMMFQCPSLGFPHFYHKYCSVGR